MVPGMRSTPAALHSAPADRCHVPSHVPSGAEVLALWLARRRGESRGSTYCVAASTGLRRPSPDLALSATPRWRRISSAYARPRPEPPGIATCTKD